MTIAMSEQVGISKQRGFRLRCFLSAAVTLGCIGSISTMAQVDCVLPRQINVSRIQGHVYDPWGRAIPGAEVSLSDAGKVIQQQSTDEEGSFSFPQHSGRFEFAATVKFMQPSRVVLQVGNDLVHFIHHDDLFVLIGLPGSYCSWITTSHREFAREIANNKIRMKEFKEKNATQK